MHILNDAVIVGGGIIAQATAGDITSIGTAISTLGPTAILGIGIVWAIRRGDKLVVEVHELREKHDELLKASVAALTQATTALQAHVNIVQHCKDTAAKRG